MWHDLLSCAQINSDATVALKQQSSEKIYNKTNSLEDITKSCKPWQIEFKNSNVYMIIKLAMPSEGI